MRWATKAVDLKALEVSRNSYHLMNHLPPGNLLWKCQQKQERKSLIFTVFIKILLASLFSTRTLPIFNLHININKVERSGGNSFVTPKCVVLLVPFYPPLDTVLPPVTLQGIL